MNLQYGNQRITIIEDLMHYLRQLYIAISDKRGSAKLTVKRRFILEQLTKILSREQQFLLSTNSFIDQPFYTAFVPFQEQDEYAYLYAIYTHLLVLKKEVLAP